MTPDDIWTHCKRKHYSAGYTSYWQAHERCEACRRLSSEAPHHIRTRGAGGDDSEENLVALCIVCHNLIHKSGREKFCKKYSHLKAKIDAALGRSKV